MLPRVNATIARHAETTPTSRLNVRHFFHFKISYFKSSFRGGIHTDGKALLQATERKIPVDVGEWKRYLPSPEYPPLPTLPTPSRPCSHSPVTLQTLLAG